MNRKFWLFWLALLLVFTFLRFLTLPKELDWSSRVRLKIGQAEVLADVARTAKEREAGLSGRSGLGDDEGMLFVFDQPGYYPFWMKEMKFPIDIIWISEDLEIVDISSNLSPDSFPQTFRSQRPVLYVLEVERGFVSQNQVGLGRSVFFLP